MGVNFEDTATAIALLGSAGLKGSDAGTSLKTMLLNLVPATDAAAKEMRSLGLVVGSQDEMMKALRTQVEAMAGGREMLTKKEKDGILTEKELFKVASDLGVAGTATSKSMLDWALSTGHANNQFFDMQGNLKPMREIMEQLKVSLAGLTKEQQISAVRTIFGTDAIRAAAIAAKLGAEGYDEMTEKMAKQGDVKRIAAERLNNLAGSWEKFTGSVETAAIMLGGLMTPTLKAMTDSATEFVNQAIEIIEQLPDAWRTVGEAFSGEWSPSATLTPFMNTVGLIGIEVRKMYDVVAPLIEQLGLVISNVLAGDIPAAFAAWLVYLQSLYALLQPIIAQWATAFVEWVAPMIPLVLAALGQAALALVGWIAEQIPILLEQLALWAKAFVDWVAPMIPPLLVALGGMLAGMLAWLTTQVTTIATALYQWFTSTIAAIDWMGLATSTGTLLGTMVGQAIVALAQSVPIIAQWLTTITQTIASVDWTTIGTTTGALLVTMVTAAIGLIAANAVIFQAWTAALITTLKAITWEDVKTTLGALLTAMITATLTMADIWTAFTSGLITGITKGITGMNATEAIAALGAWVQGVIDKALSAIKFSLPMPSFGGGGGGGGGGATPLSYNGGGDSESKLQRAYQIALSKGFTPDQANAMLGTLRVEGGLQGAVGDSGQSHGPFQLYEGGQFANFKPWLAQQGIQGDPKELAKDIEIATAFALDNYYGATLKAGSAQGLSGPALATYAQRYGQVSINPEKAGGAYGPPAGGGVPMNKMMPGADPSQWPAMIQEVIDVAPDWQTAMAQISQNGQMAYGQVMTAGTAAGTALVTSSTDDLGNVTRIYSEAGVAVGATITNAAGQIVNTWGTMATTVPAQTEAMASAALTSVTDLGGAIMTTTQDSAGSVITTVADMQGQVTSQYATLANGATLTMGDMAAGIMTSTTDLGTGVMTTVQDMSGNYITTITDLTGNVTSQYTTMGTDVVTAAGTMNTDATAEVAEMATDSGVAADGMAASVALAAQLMATDATLAALAMQTDVVKAADDMNVGAVEAAGTMVTDFGEALAGLEEPVGGATELMESVGEIQIEAPDVSDVIDAMEDVKDAAEDAADAIKDINSASKGGSKGGNSGLGKNKKSDSYLMSSDSWPVAPVRDGGGGAVTYLVTVNVNGALLANDRMIEEAVVQGLDSARRRGRET